jgi:hypothetical protein
VCVCVCVCVEHVINELTDKAGSLISAAGAFRCAHQSLYQGAVIQGRMA